VGCHQRGDGMSHQDRRDPLPEDYQYPTHGVDCDCVTCRNDIVQQMDRRIADMVFESVETADPSRGREKDST